MLWFDEVKGNVIVTVEDVNGKSRRIKHVTKMEADWCTIDDSLYVYSRDDKFGITALKMSKVKKITIEIKENAFLKLLKEVKNLIGR